MSLTSTPSVFNQVSAQQPIRIAAAISAASSPSSATLTQLQSSCEWIDTSNQVNVAALTNSGAITLTSACSLVIASNTLATGSSYTFQLTVTDLSTPSTYRQQSADYGRTIRSLTVQTGALPSGGSMTLSAVNASLTTFYAFDTMMRFTVSSWTSDFLPLMYSYSYTASPEAILSSATDRVTFDSTLPAGQVSGIVTVTDALNNAVRVSRTVTVLPLTSAQQQTKLCQLLTSVSSSNSSADANLQTALVQSRFIASLQLNATSLSIAQSQCNVSVSAADATATLINSIGSFVQSQSGSSTNSSLDCNSVAVLVSTLDRLTSQPSVLNDAGVKAATNVVTSIVTQLTSQSSSMTLMCRPVYQSLASLMSNLLSSFDCTLLRVFQPLINNLLSASSTQSIAGEQSVLLSSSIFSASATTISQTQASSLSSKSVAASSTSTSIKSSPTIQTVSLASGFSHCYNKTSPTDTQAADVTDIRLIGSDGREISVANLTDPVSFRLRLTRSSSSISNATSVQVQCASGDVHTVQQSSVPVCVWADPDNHNALTSAGCNSSRVLTDSSDGSHYVICTCSHYTEFTVLFRATELPNPCKPQKQLLGSILYLVAAFCYGVLLFVSATQLTRLAMASRKLLQTLVGLQHALLILLTSFRVLHMLVYWRYHSSVSVVLLALISSVPHILSNWIFSAVIFVWAGMYHAARAGPGSENPLTRYRFVLVVVNCLVMAVVIVLSLTLVSNERDVSERERLALAGGLLTAGLGLVTSTFFLLYGSLLFKSLTADFASSAAKKLLALAVALSFLFVASSSILALSALYPDTFAAHFDSINAAYHSLDLLQITAVLWLFKKSIDSAVAKRKSGKRLSTQRSSVFKESSTTLAPAALNINLTGLNSAAQQRQLKLAKKMRLQMTDAANECSTDRLQRMEGLPSYMRSASSTSVPGSPAAYRSRLGLENLTKELTAGSEAHSPVSRTRRLPPLAATNANATPRVPAPVFQSPEEAMQAWMNVLNPSLGFNSGSGARSTATSADSSRAASPTAAKRTITLRPRQDFAPPQFSAPLDAVDQHADLASPTARTERASFVQPDQVAKQSPAATHRLFDQPHRKPLVALPRLPDRISTLGHIRSRVSSLSRPASLHQSMAGILPSLMRAKASMIRVHSAYPMDSDETLIQPVQLSSPHAIAASDARRFSQVNSPSGLSRHPQRLLLQPLDNHTVSPKSASASWSPSLSPSDSHLPLPALGAFAVSRPHVILPIFETASPIRSPQSLSAAFDSDSRMSSVHHTIVQTDRNQEQTHKTK